MLKSFPIVRFVMHIIEKELRSVSSPERAKINEWFFKTGKGDYGEGDLFLGVRVPEIRRIINKNLKSLNIEDALILLKSPFHEIRLSAVILMTMLRKKAVKNKDYKLLNKLYIKYLENTRYINNWDIVDASARQIIGEYLVQHDIDLSVLSRLAESKNLWERRIAVIASWAFIKKGNPKITFELCRILLADPEDLIHKACGWMLREIGKNCSLEVLDSFLNEHVCFMPRVMLRYSLEKHSSQDKRKYLMIKK